MSITRREMCALIPAVLPLAAQLQAFGQDNSLPSGAFPFDKAPMHVANNNAQVRLMMRGKLATGEGLEVHQTTLPPGGAPTATRTIIHTLRCGSSGKERSSLRSMTSITAWSQARSVSWVRMRSTGLGMSALRLRCILW